MFWANLDNEDGDSVPEICENFLNNACPDDQAACTKLHAKYPFLWQSQLKGTWHDLPEFHSMELEAAFSEVHEDGTVLSSADTETGTSYFDDSQHWSANFDEMTIDKDNTCLQMRRLSTPSSVLSVHKLATEFEWFFLGEQKRWIKFGQTNKSIRNQSATRTSSDDMEIYFAKNKIKHIIIRSSQHIYEIDFEKMTQMNTQTKVVRPIRRRVKMVPIVTASNSQTNINSASNSPVDLFDWFFKDDHDQWVKYGQRSAGNRPNSATSIVSGDIETHFSSNPNKPMDIESNDQKYVLDFQKMSQTNKATLVERPMRRVLNTTSPDHLKTVKSKTKSGKVTALPQKKRLRRARRPLKEYEWFFKDDHDQWVQYGQPSTGNNADSATSTVSADIESHFIHNQDTPMDIESNNHEYLLDFHKMSQTNKETLVERKIRRVLKQPSGGKLKVVSSPIKSSGVTQISLENKLASISFPEEKYEWFFKDEKGSWIKYGQLNTMKKTDCVTKLSSDDIEKQYNEEPTKCMIIESQQHTYLIDFAKMMQTNKKTGVERPICRKLENIQVAQNDVKVELTVSAVYEWFFNDENGDWVKYGNTNATNGTDHITVSSADIEKHFTTNPNVPLDIKSPQNEYTIDFVTMTQKNKKTNVERPVCRRAKIISMTSGSAVSKAAKPRCHRGFVFSIWEVLTQPPAHHGLASASTSNSTIFPEYWTPLNNAPYLTVQLTAANPEYVKYTGFIRQTLPNFTLRAMYRIQNPFLWKAYVNKKECMMQMNPGIKFKEDYLFHGTSSKNIKAICEENLDWRLHGQSHGQMYGRGSYFSNSAQVSAGYAGGGAGVLLIVRVLIGHITKGNSGTIRPPSDGQGRNYDTTVDDVNSPKIFVKYDTQEYYPEYYVEYQ